MYKKNLKSIKKIRDKICPLTMLLDQVKDDVDDDESTCPSNTSTGE